MKPNSYSDGDRVQVSRGTDTFAGRRGVVIDADPESSAVKVDLGSPYGVLTFESRELRHQEDDRPIIGPRERIHVGRYLVIGIGREWRVMEQFGSYRMAKKKFLTRNAAVARATLWARADDRKANS